MKKTILSTLFTLLFCSAIHAETVSVGGDILLINTSVEIPTETLPNSSGSAALLALRVKAEYHFNSILSAGCSIAAGVGDDEIYSDQASDVNGTTHYTIYSMMLAQVSFFARAAYNVTDKFKLFANAGFTASRMDTEIDIFYPSNFDPNYNQINRTDDGVGIGLGAGGLFKISKRHGIALEVVRFPKADFNSQEGISQLGVSLGYVAMF